MLNAITIDVEDYFHVTAFERYIDPAQWDNYPLRVVDNTRRILDLLDQFSVKGTFFVLGWIARRCPALVQEIDSRGHEIACHGYGHQLIYRMTPAEFRSDVRRAKDLLENICGKAVLGYRAPSYSVITETLWALDILIEEGFLFDSSIFPIRHDIYGMPDAERFPHQIRRSRGIIREFPLSTLNVNIADHTLRIPVAGGGYLRLLPAWFVAKAISRINRFERRPAILYVHPWETDPDQPRIKACLRSRFRHYLNLDTTMPKLRYLLEHLRFAPVTNVLNRELSLSAPAEQLPADHAPERIC